MSDSPDSLASFWLRSHLNLSILGQALPWLASYAIQDGNCGSWPAVEWLLTQCYCFGHQHGYGLAVFSRASTRTGTPMPLFPCLEPHAAAASLPYAG
jgi:hypothetical protein